MKPLLLLSIIIIIAAGCGGGKAAKEVPVKKNVYYPYSPEYTEEFAEGDPEHTKTVLNVWRAFERGAMGPVRGSFADSLLVGFPDGVVFKGAADAVLKQWQERRNSWSYVESFPDSWMPVRATDPGENLVLVWGRQLRTDHQGRKTWEALHEVWRMDSSGRIKFMQQYSSPVY
jgi:hypothetical protein